ncbi:hypothetical protein FSP39_000397 [Pinctada imbricata]|uniref:Uncharacterized protein n=1 Tax=Pinctada imbricata TaxID=66713 RepID=A0AA88XXP2_PINIB|nr:hypothetical protein FSP39_000397 [Pinctada imbricata]
MTPESSKDTERHVYLRFVVRICIFLLLIQTLEKSVQRSVFEVEVSSGQSRSYSLQSRSVEHKHKQSTALVWPNMSTSTSDLLNSSRNILYEDEGETDITLGKLFSLVKNMEISMNQRLNDINVKIDAKNECIEGTLKKVDDVCEQMISLSNRVKSIETELGVMNKTCSDFHDNMQGMSDIFDNVKQDVQKAEKEIKVVKTTLKDMETSFNSYKSSKEAELHQLKETNEDLSDKLLDMRCRSMKYNLIFSCIPESPGEDTESVLRDFMYNELEIEQEFEYANVHRFGRQSKDRPRPIVAKFLFQRDLDYVLKSARKLRGKRYQINRQFPNEIEQARRCLYPVMKELRKKGDRVKLVRDTLFVNGEPYQPEHRVQSPSASRYYGTPTSARKPSRKRFRVGSTPEHP